MLELLPHFLKILGKQNELQLLGLHNQEELLEGFSIEKNQVVLDRPIKEIGHHEIRVKLHPEVTSNISIYISRSQEEAEALIKGEITKTETAKEDTINLEEIFEEGAVPESVNEEDVALDENEVTLEEETNSDSNADLSNEEVEDKSDT